jgi:hypothetical protein
MLATQARQPVTHFESALEPEEALELTDGELA